MLPQILAIKAFGIENSGIYPLFLFQSPFDIGYASF